MPQSKSKYERTIDQDMALIGLLREVLTNPSFQAIKQRAEEIITRWPELDEIDIEEQYVGDVLNRFDE